MATRGQEEFLQLPFQEKLQFLYGLPARQKRDLILSAPEAERLVQSFSPETLFYTLKEIGSADAGDLLSMAVPEQVKGLIDLDCWNKDRPNLPRMREWIEAMAEGGRKRLADAFMELDVELVTLVMRQYVKVHRLDEAQAALDLNPGRFVQFDEHYLIEFVRHDNILPLMQDFLEEVFERDYDYFASLMEEIYWGVEAELEENAYQFRRSRLNDRGFPDYFDAQEVFAYLDPQKFLAIRSTYVPPSREDLLSEDELNPNAALISFGGDNSLFNAALTAGFAAQGKRQLRSEMALVSNEVLVARAVDFGDLDAVRESIETTHHFLNLGLENLAGGDLQHAIGHLRDTHLKLLFRLGLSLTIDLRKRAEAAITSLGFGPDRVREIPYLDSPYREALEGFLMRLPQYYGGLDRDGSVVMRDFAAMRDLHVGYAALEQIDALRPLFRSLVAIDIASPGFRAAIAGREIRLSQILLTAFVNATLGDEATPGPIAASRLNEVRDRVMDSARVPARLGEAFHRRVEELLAARLDQEVRRRSADYLNSCLNLLEEEFSELDPSREIDPRYIRSLLLRQG